jgi:glycosyltransferase involved in cell wall biosynthesis
MRFREKGGEKAFEAFESIYESQPELKFVVIGERPPHHVSNHPGVEVLGFLDKRIHRDLFRFRSELSRALCLVHPTDMDMTPCILVEAAYWGCPVIAPSRFGIPEMVKGEVTGLLLPDNFTVADIQSALARLLRGTADYKQMRTMARKRSLESFTYDVIAEKMLAVVNQF